MIHKVYIKGFIVLEKEFYKLFTYIETLTIGLLTYVDFLFPVATR